MRQRRPKPLEVRTDHRVGAVQCGVEIAFGRRDVQNLLLDFCWADGSALGCCASLSSFSIWSILIIVVRIGDARLVLELCEEEVIVPNGITKALDGR